MNCCLCDSANSRKLCNDKHRSYYHCGKCGLIFVPSRDHVSIEEEKKRYNLHENSPDHEGHIRFLSELVSVVATQCAVFCRILDYGSGPAAALTELLRKRGYDCTAYDPNYHIGTEALSTTYDAVILCEVVEHLRDMKAEAAKIRKVLNRGAAVLLRTKLYPSLDGFNDWWYKNDSTHVNFFSRNTLGVFAALLGLKRVAHIREDIFIMHGG